MIPLDMIYQIAFAGVISVGIVMLLGRQGHQTLRTGAAKGEIAFLFDGDALVDATRPARTLLQSAPPAGSDLNRLINVLRSRFPGLEAALETIDECGRTVIPAADGGEGHVLTESIRGAVRLSLGNDEPMVASVLAGELTARAMRQEIETLRTMADDSPQLMWRETQDRTIVWANRAYLDLADRVAPESAGSWPPAHLFDSQQTPGADGCMLSQRQAVNPSDGSGPIWFSTITQINDGYFVHMAADISEQIRAEDLQRDLMQTVTKTFAGLGVGLAVFDRNRQLVVFNPALSDLTGIKPIDLAQRPRIDSVLDMMRECRVLPEPQNYAEFRRTVSDVNSDMLRDDLVEKWALPDGRSYRFTARPFPNGAVALFVEDVTSATELNRELVAQKALLAEAANQIPDAFAIFDRSGKLELVNDADADLWSTPAGATFEEVIADWRGQCLPSTQWDAILSPIRKGGALPATSVKVLKHDGRSLTITAQTTAAGSVMLSTAQDGRRVKQIPTAATPGQSAR